MEGRERLTAAFPSDAAVQMFSSGSATLTSMVKPPTSGGADITAVVRFQAVNLHTLNYSLSLFTWLNLALPPGHACVKQTSLIDLLRIVLNIIIHSII
jgi:hypothetical protein